MGETLERIKTLVGGFTSLNQRLDSQRWQHDQLAFTKLLAGWQAMQRMGKHIEKVSAPHYNVFYVMKNMDASEVKLHSPFLADLFNVNGEHKQGDLFYRELINIIAKKIIFAGGTTIDANQYLPKDQTWMSADTEVWSGSGGIDILITCRSGTDKFAIAIENKIYAGDQDKQLERYHQYLQQEFGSNFVLVYLTPDGREPSKDSASENFLKDKVIPCLSYREDVVSLLQKTIPQIIPPAVRSAVEQYLQVCQNL
jgi:PD-(D/E)XK nuclease superfamily